MAKNINASKLRLRLISLYTVFCATLTEPEEVDIAAALMAKVLHEIDHAEKGGAE